MDPSRELMPCVWISIHCWHHWIPKPFCRHTIEKQRWHHWIPKAFGRHTIEKQRWPTDVAMLVLLLLLLLLPIGCETHGRFRYSIWYRRYIVSRLSTIQSYVMVRHLLAGRTRMVTFLFKPWYLKCRCGRHNASTIEGMQHHQYRLLFI
jgi:hypothetical protein